MAIAGLAFLILIHEAGHFLVALAVGMRPRRFYLFFPPAVVKHVRNGIEYGIGAIPLGGYVKIPGMHRPAAGDLEAHADRAVTEAPWLEAEVAPAKRALEEERYDAADARLAELRAAAARAELSEGARRQLDRGVTDIEDALSPDAYWRAAAWKKVAVIFAGPATNLVFAVALLALVFTLGVPVDVTRTVNAVSPEMPAAQAGLQPGDTITAIDGERVTSETISRTIRESGGKPLTLSVLRDGDQIGVGPVRAKRDEGVYRLGFELRARYESFGPVDSVRLAVEDTWRVIELTGVALGRIATGKGREDVSSPVGIVQGSSQAIDDLGYRSYLRILAFISLSLALLNLLPLLPLDGGHITFSLIEAARGRAIPRVAYERFSAIGIVLVLFLFFIGLSNDLGGRDTG